MKGVLVLPYTSIAPGTLGDRVSRKDRLRKLDRILESLEQLNLRDELSVPPALHDELTREGIGVYPDSSISELLEQVWTRQEIFLSRAPDRPRTIDSPMELNTLFRCYLDQADPE